MIKYSILFKCIFLAYLLLACNPLTLVQDEPPTPLSQVQPVDFDVQVATVTRTPTSTPEPRLEPLPTTTPDEFLALGSAPTDTPVPLPTADPDAEPTSTATLVIQATAEPTLAETELGGTEELTATEILADTESLTPTEVVEQPVVAVAPEELDPPLQGGDWDFEAEFVLWTNPFGDCSGAAVGIGWTAFVEQGQFGSSCFGENLFPGDVQSGAKSQEITFDFIAANSGLFRTIDTYPGHRYQIIAHAKHVRSLAPVQVSLGVEMEGSTVWNAETIQWFAWDDPAEDVWKMTEEEVTATGERMTIFIKGFHPTGDQGGKTYVDNVSVTHLGP